MDDDDQGVKDGALLTSLGRALLGRRSMVMVVYKSLLSALLMGRALSRVSPWARAICCSPPRALLGSPPRLCCSGRSGWYAQSDLVSQDERKPCRRRTDTTASTVPLMTQGKEFRGAMRTLKSAREVNTTSAVSLWPSSTKRPKVKRLNSRLVATQK